MKAKELAELLLKNQDLDVWFSPDIGIGEGGIKVDEVTLKLAINAGLDGDEIDDEYFYIEDFSKEEIEQKLNEGYFLVGGTLFPKAISKRVIILT